MADLTNSRVIKLKGLLFLFLGLVALFSLLLQDHSPRTVALLAIAIWSFCRFYYFAFYVIEHYVKWGRFGRASGKLDIPLWIAPIGRS